MISNASLQFNDCHPLQMDQIYSKWVTKCRNVQSLQLYYEFEYTKVDAPLDVCPKKYIDTQVVQHDAMPHPSPPKLISVQVPLVPKYRQNVPFGISVFQTQPEYNECLYNIDGLNKRFDKHIQKVQNQQAKDELISKQKMRISKLKLTQGDVKTPLPAEKHTYCGICNMNYSNFKEHVQSMIHKESVIMDKDGTIQEIDDLISEFNEKLESKKAPAQDQISEDFKNRKIIKLVRHNLKKQISNYTNGEPTNNSISQPSHLRSLQTTAANTIMENGVFKINNVLNLNKI